MMHDVNINKETNGETYVLILLSSLTSDASDG